MSGLFRAGTKLEINIQRFGKNIQIFEAAVLARFFALMVKGCWRLYEAMQ